MKEEYGRSLQILLAVCGMVLSDRLCQRSEFAARARRQPPRPDRSPPRHRRNPARNHLAGSDRKRAARDSSAASRVSWLPPARPAASHLAFHSAHFLPISTMPSLRRPRFRLSTRPAHWCDFGAAPAWFATRTDPADALRGTGRGNTDRSSFARKALLVLRRRCPSFLVAGATMLGPQPQQTRAPGFRFPGRQPRRGRNPRPQLRRAFRARTDRFLSPASHENLRRIPGVDTADIAMYNPLTDNWGELIMVAGHPPAKINAEPGASWDRVGANYLQNLGVPSLQRPPFHRSR